MTLIYEYNDEKMTLEQIVKKFPRIWEHCITDSYLFWTKYSLDNIIIEASDMFEEILEMEHNETIIFIEDNDKGFDINFLLIPVKKMISRW